MPIFRQPRVVLRCAVLGLSTLIASNASAQASATQPVRKPPEPALRLTWENDDAACSGDDVSARALQMVTPGVTARPLRANVQVRRENDQWLVRLQTESGDQSGRRILRAESCKEIQAAIALLLAMAMESKGDIRDPDPTAPEPGAPAPAPPPAAAVTAAPASPALVVATSASDARDEGPAAEVASSVALGWFVRLDGKAADGLKPGLGLGVGVTGGVRLGDFDVGLGAAHWPETRARSRRRDASVDVERQNLALHACWNVWRTGGLVLAPCVAPGLTLFRFRSTGLRVDTREDSVRPQPSLTAAADLRYELLAGRLSVLLSPGLTWERPQPFEIDLTVDEPPAGEPLTILGKEEIYKTRGFGPRLEIGVDARF